MIQINWDEFKEYKSHSHKKENFDILLDFMKSYYNMTCPSDIYASLSADTLAQMMLEKHKISDDEALENYLFKR
ncbi:MAG: hypothetical protein U9Q40_04780 [Campylobacterota bacterium]|nr:hypothetical protein [Campylobacterota bacterium]